MRTGGTQQNDESLGTLCEYNYLARRSPSGYNQPKHINLIILYYVPELVMHST